MQLRNLHNVADQELVDIRIANGVIKDVIGDPQKDSISNEPTIIFDDAIVFPGLINSHDHLDFNLFPQLGNKVYNNYVEWGNDIHEQDADTIRSIQKIPKHLRVEWGIYKNLLNGVTTVVDHGMQFKVSNELITVFQNTQSLHSVRMEQWWPLKLNNIFNLKFPVTIHVGEGTDLASFNEINKLIKWNVFKRDLVGIHGVAMNREQATSFKALVWCPASNFFLVGTSAPVNQLKHSTKIIFGTDSTVSASRDIWEQLRIAKATHMLKDYELFKALTTVPADVWGMKGRGSIIKNNRADVVVAKKRNALQGLEAFFAVTPEDIFMVMHKGNINLFDSSLLPQVEKAGVAVDGYYKLNVGGTDKYVKGNMPELMKQIREHCPNIDLGIS